MSDTLNIVPIPALSDNYIWAIINPQKHTVLIVDPGQAKPVLNFLQQEGLSLRGILLTHHHWDHTNGVSELIINNNTIPIFGPAQDGIAGLSHNLKGNDKVELEDFPTFTVISIPGHTKDHIAYYTEGHVFCGDTLFSAGCGRIFEGTAEQMVASLSKLSALPLTTKIYCAHEYTLNNLRFAQLIEPTNQAILDKITRVQILRNNNQPSLPTSVAEELQTNPFLRCHENTVRNSVAMDGQANSVTVFAALRKWKDKF